MKKVLNESKAGKDAQEFLKKTFNANIKEASNMEKSLKEEEADLLSKKNILSKDEYGKKMNTLRKKMNGSLGNLIHNYLFSLHLFRSHELEFALFFPFL